MEVEEGYERHWAIASFEQGWAGSEMRCDEVGLSLTTLAESKYSL